MSEDSLRKVAAECGFGNKSRLVNLFRNATGLPPGQWRRVHATPFAMRPMQSSKKEVSVSTLLLDGKHFDASVRS